MGNAIIKNYYKSILLVFVLIASSVSMINGQQWTQVGNYGVHQFQSLQPAENLSFYLFGDGHHSFAQNPRHTYAAPSYLDPVQYSAEPYEDDEEVEESIMAPTTGSTPGAVNMMTLESNIQIKRSWSLVQGMDNFFVLSFENKEENPISGCVEFYYNKTDLDIDESKILDDYDNGWVSDRDNISLNGPYTNKFVWNYDNLESGEQRHIYIDANCIPEAFSKVETRAVLNVSYEGGCGHSGGTSSSYDLLSYVKNDRMILIVL